MMESAVRSLMLPPIADNMSTNFAALSLVILVLVSQNKFTHISEVTIPSIIGRASGQIAEISKLGLFLADLAS